jgi:SPX domain protein involved in polyphosphate accumulation
MLVLVALVAGSAFADIPDRIINQQRRIDQGIVSGQLTPREADILLDNLHWIKAEYGRMKEDGRLTPNEIKRLELILEQNSQMIFNKKQNPIIRVYQTDIPGRIANQQYRIREGIASGELTRSEADILRDNLDWIRMRFSQMKSDRRLTQHEIAKLETMLDRSSAIIFNKKHNPVIRLY